MRTISCLLIIFFSTATQHVKSQTLSLDTYRWENRLILIVAENPEEGKMVEQLKLFQNEQEALSDRKLLIFKIHAGGCTVYNSSMKPIQNTENKDLFEEFGSNSAPFQILLIGLDGGINTKRNRVTDPAVFFAEIDTMPLRRNELRGKE